MAVAEERKGKLFQALLYEGQAEKYGAKQAKRYSAILNSRIKNEK